MTRDAFDRLVLGRRFGRDKSNARHTTPDALEVLAGMADFSFDPPGRGRPRVSTRDRVMDTFSEVRAVIDAKEQPFRHPAGWRNRVIHRERVVVEHLMARRNRFREL